MHNTFENAFSPFTDCNVMDIFTDAVREIRLKPFRCMIQDISVFTQFEQFSVFTLWRINIKILNLKPIDEVTITIPIYWHLSSFCFQ